MAYRDNVSALAVLRGISNDPGLEEKDLGIGGLCFYNDRNSFTRHIGGKMNRGARLFFEYHADMLSKGTWVINGQQFRELLALAPAYFAELWDDVENRPLLRAFKDADAVVLYRKSNPQWLKDFNRGCDEEIVPDLEG